jgi:Flp pilus assembly protein TadD
MFDDEAVPVLERLLRVAPSGWIAPKYLAEIALRRGEFDRAVEMFRRLQRVCPMDPASWRGLAGIFLKRGEYDPALPQLVELSRLDPSDADVAGDIAGIHKRRGLLREAVYWYRNALYSAPHRVDLHQSLADNSMQAGDTAAALGAYGILTRLEPDNPRHFEQAAFTAHKLGDSVASQEFARRALELDPASPAKSLIP